MNRHLNLLNVILIHALTASGLHAQAPPSDWIDPATGHRVLRLSQGVYGVPSVAAIGIAAHEAGHAIQHAKAYAPLQVRTAIVPLVNIGSNLAWIVIILGLLVGALELAWVGVGLFALSTAMAYDFLHDRIRVNTVVPGGGGIVSGMSLGRRGGDPAQVAKGAPGSAAGRPILLSTVTSS